MRREALIVGMNGRDTQIDECACGFKYVVAPGAIPRLAPVTRRADSSFWFVGFSLGVLTREKHNQRAGFRGLENSEG